MPQWAKLTEGGAKVLNEGIAKAAEVHDASRAEDQSKELRLNSQIGG